MTRQHDQDSSVGAGKEVTRLTWGQRLARIILTLILLGAGLALAWYIYTTGPKPRQRKISPLVPEVEVLVAKPQTIPLTIHALGKIEAISRVRLAARVSGEVQWVNPKFEPGNLLEAGTALIRLDDSDYRIALAQRQAELARLQAQLAIEEENARIALEEWQREGQRLAGKSTPGELLLRKPQREALQAQIKAAKAAIEKARLDLERCQVSLPFRARVASRLVARGSVISQQTAIGEFIQADRYRINLTVQRKDLPWLTFPDHNQPQGSLVKIFPGSSHEIMAHLTASLPDIEPQSMMVQVLAEFDAGHHTGSFVGEVVRAMIVGKKLTGKIVIPRECLHGEDTLWLVQDGKLHMQKIVPLYMDQNIVVVQEGIAAGDQVITSQLSLVVEGMPVKVRMSPARKPERNE